MIYLRKPDDVIVWARLMDDWGCTSDKVRKFNQLDNFIHLVISPRYAVESEKRFIDAGRKQNLVIFSCSVIINAGSRVLIVLVWTYVVFILSGVRLALTSPQMEVT